MAHISVSKVSVAQINLAHFSWLIWTGSHRFGSCELGSNGLAQVRRRRIYTCSNNNITSAIILEWNKKCKPLCRFKQIKVSHWSQVLFKIQNSLSCRFYCCKKWRIQLIDCPISTTIALNWITFKLIKTTGIYHMHANVCSIINVCL